MCVEITGKEKWRWFFISAPDVGRANISIEGVHRYDGRATVKNAAFEITDSHGSLVLRSAPEDAGRWQAFLGHGSHVVRDSDGQELARIRYSRGGFRRTVIFGGQEFPCSWRGRIVLPGGIISYPSRRVVRTEISDETHRLAYLGIAFYLWLRQDFSDA